MAQMPRALPTVTVIVLISRAAFVLRRRLRRRRSLQIRISMPLHNLIDIHSVISLHAHNGRPVALIIQMRREKFPHELALRGYFKHLS